MVRVEVVRIGWQSREAVHADIAAVEVRWGRWDAEVGVGRVAVAHWAAASLMNHVKTAVGDHATNDPVGAGVDGLTGATVLAGDQPNVDELATYGG